MRLLLDTHALLWWVTDDARLSKGAADAIADPASVVHISPVSVWEISIKARLGRVDWNDLDPNELAAAGPFVELPVRIPHGWRAGDLPRHHDDPFDRMLIAQAQLEDLTIVSRDRAFALYDVKVIEA